MKTAFCSMFAMILFVGDAIVAQEVPPTQVVIQTAAPALSPEEIERLVTVPIEEAVRDIPGLQCVRSQSAQGISVIMLSFPQGTEMSSARLQVYERLNVLSELPEGVKTPRLRKATKK